MKKAIIALLVLVVIAAAIFGSQYAMHAKGDQCVQNGAYEDAAAYYAKDSFFSKGLMEEAMRMAGLDYLEKGNYEKSIEILEVYGADLQDELCQAYCGIARGMLPDAPEDALKILNEQNPTANTQVLVNTVRMEIAQLYLENLRYDDALHAAETVSDPSFDGVQEVKNEVYFTKGLNAFHAMFEAEEPDAGTTATHLRDILQQMELCVDDSRTAPFTNLITPLLEGRFEEAVAPAFALMAEYPDYDAGHWLTVFRNLMPDESYADWKDQLINQQRIFAMFGQRDNTLTGSNMQETITNLVDTKKTACYDVFDYDVDIPSYTDVKTVLKSLGSNPNGKVLILREYWGERDGAPSGTSQKQKRLAVYGDLMNCMPAKFYPTSLDEVEYVIVISYDYKVTGIYSGWGRVISGYQENGSVTAYSLPGSKSIYTSGTQNGSKLGKSVSMSKDQRVLSGGRPQLGSYVVKALETVEKKTN